MRWTGSVGSHQLRGAASTVCREEQPTFIQGSGKTWSLTKTDWINTVLWKAVSEEERYLCDAQSKTSYAVSAGKILAGMLWPVAALQGRGGSNAAEREHKSCLKKKKKVGNLTFKERFGMMSIKKFQGDTVNDAQVCKRLARNIK